MQKKKEIAHDFVLSTLLDSSIGDRIRTKPMFGCLAIYIDEKIVFILRHRDDKKTARDNGVWVVAQLEHVESLLADFPALRPIEMFRKKASEGIPTWNNLPETDDRFEEIALELCDIAIEGDPRLGRVPGQKKPKKKTTTGSKSNAERPQKKKAKSNQLRRPKKKSQKRSV